MPRMMHNMIEISEHHDTIYRLYMVWGWTRKRIAKDLGIHLDSLSRYIRLHDMDKTPPYPFIKHIGRLYQVYDGLYEDEEMVYVLRKGLPSFYILDAEFFNHLINEIGIEKMEEIVNGY